MDGYSKYTNDPVYRLSGGFLYPCDSVKGIKGKVYTLNMGDLHVRATDIASVTFVRDEPPHQAWMQGSIQPVWRSPDVKMVITTHNGDIYYTDVDINNATFQKDSSPAARLIRDVQVLYPERVAKTQKQKASFIKAAAICIPLAGLGIAAGIAWLNNQETAPNIEATSCTLATNGKSVTIILNRPFGSFYGTMDRETGLVIGKTTMGGGADKPLSVAAQVAQSTFWGYSVQWTQSPGASGHEADMGDAIRKCVENYPLRVPLRVPPRVPAP